MKKSVVVALHIGCWVFYLAYSAGIAGATSGFADENFLARLLSGLAFGLLYFYIFYLYLFPKFLAKRKIRQFVLWSIALGLLATPLSLLIQYFTVTPGPDFSRIDKSDDDPILVLITWFLAFLVGTFMAVINGMLGALLRGFITWYDEIHLREVLMRKNVQTELSLLKAQLNPHFLFNTLNNIDVLIEQNAQRASTYLKKLSDILRFTLYDTREEKIPLVQELEYIRKFIDLQNIRTANEDFVSYEMRGEPEGLYIAPMVFIPFIENAFKHTINKKIKNAVVISIDVKKDDLQVIFFCRNVVDKEGSVPAVKSGLGVELIKQRLQLLYGDRHSLEISHGADQYIVSLKIDLHGN
jgi:two-component system, LytTR family, sensor kinase